MQRKKANRYLFSLGYYAHSDMPFSPFQTFTTFGVNNIYVELIAFYLWKKIALSPLSPSISTELSTSKEPDSQMQLQEVVKDQDMKKHVLLAILTKNSENFLNFIALECW